MNLADAVVTSAGQPAITRVGKITGLNPLQVELDEVPLNPDAVGCASTYLPRLGDTVTLVGQAVGGSDTSASSWMIVAACVNSGSGAFAHNGIQIMASPQANNTGAFIDITGLLFPFTKRRAGSLIHGRLSGSGYSSVAAAGGEFSARILTTAGAAVGEEVLASHFWNPALTHLGFSGEDDIRDIPAGSYLVQGRFRLYTGAANIQIDGNDRFSLFFDEI